MRTTNDLNALTTFGFTAREAGFLGLVICHGGVCVPRQYAAWASIADGGKQCHAFFASLVRCGVATRGACVHNRAHVYHVHHGPLYQAIGEPHSPYRRPVPAGQVAARVLTLDAVLATPDVVWLTTPAEVRRLVNHVTDGPDGEVDSTTSRCASVARLWAARGVRIGHDRDGRFVLLYVAREPGVDDFRTVVRASAEFLRRTPQWTLRVVLAHALQRAYDGYQRVIYDEYETPLRPETLADLARSFELRRASCDRPSVVSLSGLGWPRDHRVNRRVEGLYRRWCRQGSRALDEAASTVLADALTSSCGRVEYHVLPFCYRHLIPVVTTTRRARAGVEKGDRGVERLPARPQPSILASSANVNTASVRLRRARRRCSNSRPV